MKKGCVFITGAGPGDAGLITVKALKMLQQADVVVYDYLVNNSLLKECKASCEKIYVGKKAGNHSATQDEINEIILEKAKAGHLVVRLKGGDPFVFGRGGEEALYLAERNIDYEIIPGVTSGIAAPAYAGIPVTHRNVTSSVTFVSGHDAQVNEDLNLEWSGLASLKGTLVFYMGVQNLEKICYNLILHGLSDNTAVALIRYGTYNFQKYVHGTLRNIVDIVRNANIKPPALIVVGDVVNLSEKINWFSAKPLFGKRIIVTRSRTQASTLTAILEQKGAEVIEFPTIEIHALKDYSPAKEEIRNIRKYKWILFTSVNTVSLFFKLFHELGYDSRKLASCNIASIGKETSRILRSHGIIPDLEPANFTAKAMANAFEKVDIKNLPILIPSSDIARELMPSELEKMGALVHKIVLYKTREPEYTKEELLEIFEKPVECITFTSSSTFVNFMKIAKQHPFILEKLHSTVLASIGPVTSQTINDFCMNAIVEAKIHTVEELAESIEEYFLKNN